MGLERTAAATLTAYMAVPTMVGASTCEPYTKGGALTGDDGVVTAVGSVVSFLVAKLVIRGFPAVLSRHGLAPFGWSRLAAGMALIVALTF